MAYKIRKNDFKDILGCDCCSSEVPTEEYENFDGSKRIYCEFCFTSVGKTHTTVDKQILGQMMNTLYEKLKKAKP